MTNTQRFARNLRFAYESRGMTQHELASAANVTVTHLNRIVNFQVPNVSVQVCSQLAAAVECELADLLADPELFMLAHGDRLRRRDRSE